MLLLNSIGAILVVALLIGASATLFAYWRSRQATTATPPPKQWVNVLNGYTVTSLMASQSRPSTLYACATQARTESATTLSYTLLRSTDSGSHWQEIKTALHGTCQLAVNTANGNDLYIVSMADHVASNGHVPEIISHSADGGQTWTETEPTINIPGTQITVPWEVQQLSVVGNHLFSIQWLPSMVEPPVGKNTNPAVAIALPMARLIESRDGGRTWTIIDGTFDPTLQAARDYAVSPTDPQTIYELIGTQWGPLRTPSGLPGPTVPTYGSNVSLYKTTNGGKTWMLLLKDLNYSSRIYLASDKPNIVYVGGPLGVRPMVKGEYPVEQAQPPYIYGYFSLRLSTDGGNSWRSVKEPADTAFSSWFVSADGHVYLASVYPAPVGSPTVTKGTAVPSGTGVISPGKQTQVLQPSSTLNQVNQGVMQGNATVIQRYDPLTDTWSTITKTPTSGTLFAVTPTANKSGAILWLLSFTSGKQALYRYIVQ